MQRIRLIAVIGIILFVLYICLIINNIIFHFLGDYELLVFSVLLAIISINMIHKGIVIKSSTTLWFANNMILFAITIAVLQLFKYDVDRLSYLWSIIPIIPSIINLVAFKNYLYIKLIIINIFVLLPLCIIHYISLNIWIEVAIIIGFLITSIVVCRLIKFNKENENGKI